MILVFGGTTEGRKAVEVLEEAGKAYYYSTKTGEQDISLHHGIRTDGAMDGGTMLAFCREHDIRLIVDAAHPFASQLHKTIASVAEALTIPVVRYERIYPPRDPEITWIDDYPQLSSLLPPFTSLLATTGVQSIAKLKPLEAEGIRIYYRILHRESSIALAHKQGATDDQLCFFNGPVVGEASQLCIVGEASKLCIVGEASKLHSPVVGEASQLCSCTKDTAAKLGSFTHYAKLGSFTHYAKLGSFTHYIAKLGSFTHYAKLGSFTHYAKLGSFTHYAKLGSFTHYDAILLKESGVSGGFQEKVEAAKAQGMRIIALKRPAIPQSFVTVNGPYGLRRAVEKLLPGFFPLKSGLTTGTCATAAAVAETLRFTNGAMPTEVPVVLPDGETITVPVGYGDGYAYCIKDAGDDPDVTNGLEIRASVVGHTSQRVAAATVGRTSQLDAAATAGHASQLDVAAKAVHASQLDVAAKAGHPSQRDREVEIEILGGEGVGVFTLPGFDFPPGSPAINKAPREMIRQNIQAVVGEASKLCGEVGEASKLCDVVGEASKLCGEVGEASKLCDVVGEASKLCDVVGEASQLCNSKNAVEADTAKFGSFTHYTVTISVPGGEETARRTFNPRLGIEGGISIIGVSGIVKPFSEEAFIDSIRKCMTVAKASFSGIANPDEQRVVINSGGKSERFVKALYPRLPQQAFVEYGNYIGETLKIAHELGIKNVTLGVMLGKAVKLAAGHLDTHSRKATMDKVLVQKMLEEANIAIDLSEITLARELWEKIPKEKLQDFATIIIGHCAEYCNPLLPDGTLVILLIDDEGNVYC